MGLFLTSLNICVPEVPTRYLQARDPPDRVMKECSLRLYFTDSCFPLLYSSAISYPSSLRLIMYSQFSYVWLRTLSMHSAKYLSPLYTGVTTLTSGGLYKTAFFLEASSAYVPSSKSVLEHVSDIVYINTAFRMDRPT